MILILIFWSLFFSSIETFENHPNCGHFGKGSNLGVNQRIVGGKDTNEGEFLFMAGLRYNGNFICGASLISKRWVLTAAHCIYNNNSKGYSLILGTTDLNEPELVVGVQMIVLPGCLDESKSCGDIAMIKTEREIIEIDQTDSNIGTVCLPESLTEPSNKTLIHIGWGIFKKRGKRKPDVLQMAVTQLFSEKYCIHINDFANIGLAHRRLTQIKLCVQANDNQACYGDSGGPLFEEIDGRAVQVGITSHGTGSEVLNKIGFHCNGFEAVMYTKVSAFIHWIDAIINEFSVDIKVTQIMMSTNEQGNPIKFTEMNDEERENLIRRIVFD